ncbi:hypothetical protein CDD82_1841 [Ophiocordyceps australis]|uniref:Mitochondrial import inner membrane translocase subunit TIM50 n=1 Tax=Ophiocordyceps australis TaxID=1399860 RepID=A0A2C5ZKD6_9HYPO|nr:hypothetical protein CDD82_1841 [Ophiocordyceps australis]
MSSWRLRLPVARFFSSARPVDPYAPHKTPRPGYLAWPKRLGPVSVTPQPPRHAPAPVGENLDCRSRKPFRDSRFTPQDFVTYPPDDAGRKRPYPRTFRNSLVRSKPRHQTGPLSISSAESKEPLGNDPLVDPYWKHTRPALYKAVAWFYPHDKPDMKEQPIDVYLGAGAFSMGSNGPKASPLPPKRAKQPASLSTAIPGLHLLQQESREPMPATSFTAINAKPRQPVAREESIVRQEQDRLLVQQQQQHIGRLVPSWQKPPLPPLSPRKRKPPSADSGGIPEPTKEYLRESNYTPRKLDRPRRILVVLDLNGTLLHRPQRLAPTHFIKRPHADRFLEYCLANFHVAIWSSARLANVEMILEQLLTPVQCRKLVVVWGREQLGLCIDDYNSRVQCYKRLSVLWQSGAVQASYSELLPGCWDQSNTVLVDDSPEKGRSEPYNIMAIPEFSGLRHEPKDVLPQVHDYLNRLCYARNISSHMRESPFQLNPHFVL